MKIIITIWAVVIAIMIGLAIAQAEEQREFTIEGQSVATEYLIEPANSIIFGHPEVGRLDWSTGNLIFTGNIDKSAKEFFEYAWRDYVYPNDSYKFIALDCIEKYQAYLDRIGETLKRWKEYKRQWFIRPLPR